jgi:hypothetical protein
MVLSLYRMGLIPTNGVIATEPIHSPHMMSYRNDDKFPEQKVNRLEMEELGRGTTFGNS